MHAQLQSPLLQLPVEVQLVIFELAVQEPEPLLLNCGCDSSYHGDYDKWAEDSQAWQAGTLRAPQQPSLTKTCSLLRQITLPLFYKLNTFRGHYCYRADPDAAIKWLADIGPENRRSIRDLAFWDFNQAFDEYEPMHLLQLKRSKLCKEMEGVLETDPEVEDCCFHRVTFRPSQDEFHGVEDLFAM